MAYDVNNNIFSYLICHCAFIFYLYIFNYYSNKYKNFDLILEIPAISNRTLLIISLLSINLLLVKLKLLESNALGINSGYSNSSYSNSIIAELLGNVELTLILLIFTNIFNKGFSKYNIIALIFVSISFFLPGVVKIGTRRGFVLIGIIIFITTNLKSFKSKITISILFLVLLLSAVIYQSIRVNINNPEINQLIFSNDIGNLLSGVRLLFSTNESDYYERLYRPTSSDNLYETVLQYITYFKTTHGYIFINSISWNIPGILFDKSNLSGSDDIIFYFLNIGAGGINNSIDNLDYASSIISEFVADFGFFGILLAPFFMVFLLKYVYLVTKIKNLNIYVKIISITILISSIGIVENTLGSYFGSIRLCFLMYIFLIVINKKPNMKFK